MPSIQVLLLAQCSGAALSSALLGNFLWVSALLWQKGIQRTWFQSLSKSLGINWICPITLPHQQDNRVLFLILGLSFSGWKMGENSSLEVWLGRVRVPVKPSALHSRFSEELTFPGSRNLHAGGSNSPSCTAAGCGVSGKQSLVKTPGPTAGHHASARQTRTVECSINV